MSEELRKLCGHPMYRPLVEHIARESGLTQRLSPLDGSARVDPLELAMQKAQRDFASKLIEDIGWTITLMPPAAEPAPQQTQAQSDGGSYGEH